MKADPYYQWQNDKTRVCRSCRLAISVTLNPDFKGTPLINVGYLRNGTWQTCHRQWPWSTFKVISAIFVWKYSLCWKYRRSNEEISDDFEDHYKRFHCLYLKNTAYCTKSIQRSDVIVRAIIISTVVYVLNDCYYDAQQDLLVDAKFLVLEVIEKKQNGRFFLWTHRHHHHIYLLSHVYSTLYLYGKRQILITNLITH